MKHQRVEKPEQARILNGKQLIGLAQVYALTGFAQSNCPCESCERATDDSHFFAAALAIVGAAAVEDRAGLLYEVLTKWAQENLEDFPPGLRGSLYRNSEIDFPEIIHER